MSNDNQDATQPPVGATPADQSTEAPKPAPTTTVSNGRPEPTVLIRSSSTEGPSTTLPRPPAASAPTTQPATPADDDGNDGDGDDGPEQPPPQKERTDKIPLSAKIRDCIQSGAYVDDLREIFGQQPKARKKFLAAVQFAIDPANKAVVDQKAVALFKECGGKTFEPDTEMTKAAIDLWRATGEGDKQIQKSAKDNRVLLLVIKRAIDEHGAKSIDAQKFYIKQWGKLPDSVKIDDVEVVEAPKSDLRPKGGADFQAVLPEAASRSDVTLVGRSAERAAIDAKQAAANAAAATAQPQPKPKNQDAWVLWTIIGIAIVIFFSTISIKSCREETPIGKERPTARATATAAPSSSPATPVIAETPVTAETPKPTASATAAPEPACKLFVANDQHVSEGWPGSTATHFVGRGYGKDHAEFDCGPKFILALRQPDKSYDVSRCQIKVCKTPGN